MKRLNYLVAVLLIAFSFNALAQSINEMKTYQKELNYVKNLYGKVVPADYTNAKTEKTQALTWESIVLCINSSYFSLYSRSTPLVYDPVSNLVMIGGIKFQYMSSTALSKIVGEIYYKQPTGMRWDS